MLYSLYEAQHMALAPLRFMAEWSRGWFGHPFSPFAHLPLSRRVAASSELFLRITQRYEKPQWSVAEARLKVAAQRPFCRLIHFEQAARKRHKVLLVAPLDSSASSMRPIWLSMNIVLARYARTSGRHCCACRSHERRGSGSFQCRYHENGGTSARSSSFTGGSWI